MNDDLKKRIRSHRRGTRQWLLSFQTDKKAVYTLLELVNQETVLPEKSFYQKIPHVFQ